jgi:hypothetical protein
MTKVVGGGGAVGLLNDKHKSTMFALSIPRGVLDKYTQNAVFDGLEKSQRVTSSQVGFFISLDKPSYRRAS